MIISWSSIVNSESRLAYLICDLGLVSPLLVASWIQLKRSEPVGSILFFLGAGALSYDALHFGIFLIKIKFLSIPPFVYILLIFLILLVIFILVKDRGKRVLSLIK
jgi:hypothetical protein